VPTAAAASGGLGGALGTNSAQLNGGLSPSGASGCGGGVGPGVATTLCVAVR